MGEKLQSTFNLVQRMGFFWEYPDSALLQGIVDNFDQEHVKRAAQKTVNILTDLIEGNYSARGLRLIKVLELNTLPKIWLYRNYLIQRFEAQLPAPPKKSMWITHDTADDYNLRTLIIDVEKAFKDEYVVAGVIIGEYYKYAQRKRD